MALFCETMLYMYVVYVCNLCGSAFCLIGIGVALGVVSLEFAHIENSFLNFHVRVQRYASKYRFTVILCLSAQTCTV